MKNKDNTERNICIFIIILMVLAIIVMIFQKVENTNKNQICVPKLANAYTPITDSGYKVYVFSTTDKYHIQLISEIDQAMRQIAQLRKAGQ